MRPGCLWGPPLRLHEAGTAAGALLAAQSVQDLLRSDGELWSVPSQSDCRIHPWASTLLAQFPEALRCPRLESRQTCSHPTSHGCRRLCGQLSTMSLSHTCSALQFARYFENTHSLVSTFFSGPWHILSTIRKISFSYFLPKSRV